MDICTCRTEVIYSSVHQTEKKTSSQSYNFSHAFRCKSQTVPGLEIQTYEYVNGLSNASSVYWMLKLLHMHSHTLTEEVPTGSSAARGSVSCPKTSDLPSTGRAARPPELQPAHVRVFIFNGRYNVHTFIKIYIYGTPRSKRTQNVKIKQCLLAVTLKWSSYSVGCWIYWTWNLHVELLQLQPKMLVDGDVSLSSTSTFSAYKEPTPWRNTREKVTEWGKREASSILKRRVFHSQRRRVTAAERWEAEGYYFMFILVQKSLTKINKKSLTRKKMYRK